MPGPAVDSSSSKDGGSYSNTTLFVRNLPYDATNPELETFFSNIGPIRSCFVVLDSSHKDTQTDEDFIKDLKEKKIRNKGFGFVTFVVAEDAARAIKEAEKIKFRDARKLKLEFAVKRNVVKGQKDAEPTRPPKRPISTKPLIPSSTIQRPRVIIRNLPFTANEQDLSPLFKPYGDVTSIHVPMKDVTKGWCKGFAFIEFKELKSAERAMEELNGKEVKGRKIAVDWSLPKDRYERMVAHTGDTRKSAEVVEKKEESSDEEEGKESESDADEKEEEEEEVEENDDDVEITMENSKGETIDMKTLESDDDEEEKEEKAVKKPESRRERRERKKAMEMENEKKAKEEAEKKNKLPDATEGTTLFIRNVPLEANEKELSEKFTFFGPILYARLTMNRETQTPKGTAFVCYKSKESADKCIEAFHTLLESLGGYHGISAVNNDLPTRPKSDDKKQHISILQPELPTSDPSSSVFHYAGKVLNVQIAVTRTQVTDLEKSRFEALRTDKRNMYLLPEGVVFPDMEAAKSLPPAEVSKRVASYSQRKKLLETNPALFVSKTRLSIRNLPLTIEEKELKTKIRESVIKFYEQVEQGIRKGLDERTIQEELESGLKPPNSKRKINIKQVKILRSLDRIDPKTNKPRSKGFGFIEFESHADALVCLRFMNNNEEVFGDKRKRPVVEFSVENRNILRRRDEKMMKLKNRQSETNGEGDGGNGKRKREDGEASRGGSDDGARKHQKREDNKDGNGFQNKRENNGFQKRERGDGNRFERRERDGNQRQRPNNQFNGKRQREEDQQRPGAPSKKPRQSEPPRSQPRQQQQPRQPTAPQPKKTRAAREEEKFDTLVQKYKKDLFTGSKSKPAATPTTQSLKDGIAKGMKKWFE